MAMKDYSDEFKADAVALYESTPGATYKGIAADLGVSRGALRVWVLRARGENGTPQPAAGPAARGPLPAGADGEAAARIRELEDRVRRLEASERKLTAERDILRKAAKYFAGGDALVSRFQFVDDHRDAFGVKRLCQVLGVNRSSYYKWRDGAGPRAVKEAADRALAEEIRAVHADSDGAYGSPRITAELRADGRRINHKRVARVMRKFSIAGIRLRRRVRTTIAEPSATPVPDLFGRDFTALEPGLKYMGDITYLPVGDGEFLYLATVLDCFSRRVVGWSIAGHMRTELVADALRMAARTRGGLDGSTFHSDHGAQYTSREFALLCGELGVTQSMGAVGSSADNAACESFHASLKRETLRGAHRYPGAELCRRSVFRWLTRYNTRRRHSANGQLSPVDFERRHRQESARLTLAA
ncbi:IS3 family transposase [Kitasatospora sp. NPDC086791]|uniref:IS3 family transposase n=1 Tax=Kitasatospora sp. NPDC086791 TaxID=3155178 RepID=UPI00342E416B